MKTDLGENAKKINLLKDFDLKLAQLAKAQLTESLEKLEETKGQFKVIKKKNKNFNFV